MRLFSQGLSRGFWLGLGVELFESPDFNECGLEETLALKTMFESGRRKSRVQRSNRLWSKRRSSFSAANGVRIKR